MQVLIRCTMDFNKSFRDSTSKEISFNTLRSISQHAHEGKVIAFNI